MPKTIEVDFTPGDAKANEKGEAGVVTAVNVAADGSVSYVVEVPPEARHITKALAAVDVWVANILAPHWDDKTQDWKDTKGLDAKGKPTLAFFEDRFGKLKEALRAALA